MTPKFDNLASLLMEVESPEERAARIKDIESRGYGKSKRIPMTGSARARSKVPDIDDDMKEPIKKSLSLQPKYAEPKELSADLDQRTDNWPRWWREEEQREAGKRTAPHKTNKEVTARARELRGEREEAKRQQEERWRIHVADVKRRAEKLGINTQGMTIREIFDKVEYKEFEKEMAEREEQK